jgi:hypothetical protein
MEAAVFMALAYRLPAYSGAMAAAAMRQAQEQGGGSSRGSGRTRGESRYERSSPMANNARTAASAPPATAEALAGLNAQLGGGWFSVRQVKAGEPPGGGDQHAR